MGVTAAGSYAYVITASTTVMAAAYTSMHVIDIGDPRQPFAIGCAVAPGYPRDTVSTASCIGLATDQAALQIAWPQCHELSAVNSPSPVPDAGILGTYPNPFNPRATIEFALEKQQVVKVAVYDLTGRQIACLTDRTYGPGSHSVVWDGRDSAGGEVSSGMYLIRLQTERRVDARKIMLVR